MHLQRSTEVPLKIISLATPGPNQPREPLSSAAPRQRAEANFRKADCRAIGDHPDVACERNFASTTHRRAVDCRDRRYAGIFERGEQVALRPDKVAPPRRLTTARGAFTRALREVAQVSAATEMFAGAG